ncbi:hypothetical protein TTRE_0000873201 [Trichuris trichiura]|uniref:NIDO domain-containing protein n=1 Tax=Trichuris trichiura TaxID=36087 RepID=A0A077ZIX3_TRITR|nr:hypothetical protein TTRE_0000873201 [Trichuris trichiura]
MKLGIGQPLGPAAYGYTKGYRKAQAGYVEDDEFLDKITDEIQKGINGANGFRAFHCLVVTWERMAYGGSPKIVDLENYESAKRWVRNNEACDPLTYELFLWKIIRLVK